MALDKKLFRNGPYADLFSQGVQVGNTLHMAGKWAPMPVARLPTASLSK